MSERNYIHAEKELKEFREQNKITINNNNSLNSNPNPNMTENQENKILNKITKIKNENYNEHSQQPPPDIIDRPYTN